MSQETSKIWTTNKTELTIQEKATSLLDVVGWDVAEPTNKQKKIYPLDQISPAMEAFEAELIKKREMID